MKLRKAQRDRPIDSTYCARWFLLIYRVSLAPCAECGEHAVVVYQRREIHGAVELRSPAQWLPLVFAPQLEPKVNR